MNPICFRDLKTMVMRDFVLAGLSDCFFGVPLNQVGLNALFFVKGTILHRPRRQSLEAIFFWIMGKRAVPLTLKSDKSSTDFCGDGSGGTPIACNPDIGQVLRATSLPRSGRCPF
jgi:hypothetical protein